MRTHIFTAISVVLFGMGCAPSTSNTLRGTTPTFSSRDDAGQLVGPQGGRLERAGRFYLETIPLPDGGVKRYAYDKNGAQVPVEQAESNRGFELSAPTYDPYHWW